MKTRSCGVRLGALVLAASFGSLVPTVSVLAQTPPAATVQTGNRIEKIVAAAKRTLAAS